ncbi:OmpA family protein [Flavobacterium sp. FZUC8N2.13]|uniref:OmpA family protein n=1 Tax=Flavobacterium zubiriense TaxID=3138075 RepID=A0ABV4TE16_9FLAO
MRKKIATVSLLLITFAATAQNMGTTSTERSVDVNAYNKWSIELNAGVNKTTGAMTTGFYTATPNLFHADLGVRYMFNPKFGLKLDFGYDKLKEGNESFAFDSNYLRTDLQGIINLGRVLNFETWTNRIGLLGHGGFGVSMLTSDGFNGEDYMANGIAGLTTQYRISNSVALTADFTGIINGNQSYNFDGMSQTNAKAFNGSIFNASLGLTFYLGKNEKHADWIGDSDKYDALENRVELIETSLIDSDKDGVADLYDLEPNSVAGVAVNTKGQSIDNNQNGVPDELESYLDKRFAQNSNTNLNNNTVEELINGGYVNVYFDFNSSKPTNASLSGVDFLIKYLKNNPSKSAEIIGYADEVGNSSYNQTLSQQRAEAVKNIVTNAGIDASRLTVKGNGEDNSVNKNSPEARQIVRRVTFKVN